MKDENKIKELQARLTVEQKELKQTLEKLGDEENDDWYIKIREDDGFHADLNEEADDIEDAERDLAVMSTLEIRYRQVVNALERIDSGEYGICEVCGAEIEEERLDANPAAKTCIAHMAHEDDVDGYANIESDEE